MKYARPFPAFLIVAALLLSACGDSASEDDLATGPEVTRPAPSGPERSLLLGLGAQAASETTREAYIDAFASAARHAEVVSIARVPPWEEFLPGAGVREETHALMELERGLVRQYGLTLLFAIDPTDSAVQRGRIVPLPAALDPEEGFLHEGVQEALVAYALYVAANYEPEYLAVGVEINMLRARSPAQFAAFVEAYVKVYDAVKAVRPQIKVFPTFQLEDLLGLLTLEHAPQWDVIAAFGDRLDVLAISTYPYLVSGFPLARDIPEGYYHQLRAHFGGEILISEAGYASASAEGHTWVASEREQEEFLRRLLADAQANAFSAVVWTAERDPAQRRQGGAHVLDYVGLRLSNGADKLAWAVWREWALRPLPSPATDQD